MPNPPATPPSTRRAVAAAVAAPGDRRSLLAALASPREDVRLRAALELARSGDRAGSAALVEAYGSTDSVQASGKPLEPGTIRDLLAQALRRGSASGRLQAVRELRELSVPDVNGLLEGALLDPHPRVAHAAALELTRNREHGPGPWLASGTATARLQLGTPEEQARVVIEPHVEEAREAVKALAERSYDRTRGRWSLPATPDGARELRWLESRFRDMQIEPECRAWSLVVNARERQARLDSVRLGSVLAGEACFLVPRAARVDSGGLARLDGAWLDSALDEWVVPARRATAGPLQAHLRGASSPPLSPEARKLLERLEAAERRARTLSELSRAEDAPLDISGLGGELYPFQRAAVAYALETRRTFIADEQGLGKTVEALTALESAGTFPAIVVCPASVALAWEREAQLWLPRRSVSVVRSGRSAELRSKADITVLSYSLLPKHVEALARLEPRALVIDESHSVKSGKAKRTVAARALAARVPDDGLVLCLSGTPLLNRPMELVSQLEVLGQLEELGGFKRFWDVYRHERDLNVLHDRLRETCFVRRRKEQVLPQLPAKRRAVIPVEISNGAEYARAEADVIGWLRERVAREAAQAAELAHLPPAERDARAREIAHDAAERAQRAERLVRLTALRAVAARGKLPAAIEWIREFLHSGEKLVVFAHHIDVQHGLLDAFPGAARILGQDSSEHRQAEVDRFQNDPACRLVVGSLQAAGVGITLTAASNVAFVELGWTPAIHDQAEDRAHRIGQSGEVTAWYLLGANTIDERIAALIERKRSVVDAASDGAPIAEERTSVLGDLVAELVHDEPEPLDQAA